MKEKNPCFSEEFDVQKIDIGSRGEYPAGDLSNFSPHRFIFDGVVCLSAEGLLQSLKFTDFSEQKKICKLIGVQAKKAGIKKNETWQAAQTLWWRGKSYQREGLEYQRLLNRIFRALAKNSDFQIALLATGKRLLIHSIGKSDCQKTVLTEAEFCNRLTVIRKKLLKPTV